MKGDELQYERIGDANKIIKQKSGFTIKDVKFGGVKLEGKNTHKKEA